MVELFCKNTEGRSVVMAKYQYSGPAEFRPLSPWQYFGYSLLFAIPLVGFVCLLVCCFSDSNINRRNYARSFFCGLLIALIIVAFFTALSLAGVISFSALRALTGHTL